MKFQAAVIFDFRANSIAEAAGRLDELLKHAEDRHEMAHGHVELRTPPAQAGSAAPVILPYFGGATRDPGPQAEAAPTAG
jgi:hypothetical protein